MTAQGKVESSKISSAGLTDRSFQPDYLQSKTNPKDLNFALEMSGTKISLPSANSSKDPRNDNSQTSAAQQPQESKFSNQKQQITVSDQIKASQTKKRTQTQGTLMRGRHLPLAIVNFKVGDQDPNHPQFRIDPQSQTNMTNAKKGSQNQSTSQNQSPKQNMEAQISLTLPRPSQLEKRGQDYYQNNDAVNSAQAIDQSPSAGSANATNKQPPDTANAYRNIQTADLKNFANTDVSFFDEDLRLKLNMQQLSVTKCEFEIDDSHDGEHHILKVQELTSPQDYTQNSVTSPVNQQNKQKSSLSNEQRQNGINQREKSTLMAKLGNKSISKIEESRIKRLQQQQREGGRLTNSQLTDYNAIKVDSAGEIVTLQEPKIDQVRVRSGKTRQLQKYGKRNFSLIQQDSISRILVDEQTPPNKNGFATILDFSQAMDSTGMTRNQQGGPQKKQISVEKKDIKKPNMSKNDKDNSKMLKTSPRDQKLQIVNFAKATQNNASHSPTGIADQNGSPRNNNAHYHQQQQQLSTSRIKVAETHGSSVASIQSGSKGTYLNPVSNVNQSHQNTTNKRWEATKLQQVILPTNVVQSPKSVTQSPPSGINSPPTGAGILTPGFPFQKKQKVFGSPQNNETNGLAARGIRLKDPRNSQTNEEDNATTFKATSQQIKGKAFGERRLTFNEKKPSFHENQIKNQNKNANGPILSTLNVKFQQSAIQKRVVEENLLDLPKSPETEKNQINQERMDLELSKQFNENLLSGQHILELDQSREDIDTAVKNNNQMGGSSPKNQRYLGAEIAIQSRGNTQSNRTGGTSDNKFKEQHIRSYQLTSESLVEEDSDKQTQFRSQHQNNSNSNMSINSKDVRQISVSQEDGGQQQKGQNSNNNQDEQQRQSELVQASNYSSQHSMLSDSLLPSRFKYNPPSSNQQSHRPAVVALETNQNQDLRQVIVRQKTFIKQCHKCRNSKNRQEQKMQTKTSIVFKPGSKASSKQKPSTSYSTTKQVVCQGCLDLEEQQISNTHPNPTIRQQVENGKDSQPAAVDHQKPMDITSNTFSNAESKDDENQMTEQEEDDVHSSQHNQIYGVDGAVNTSQLGLYSSSHGGSRVNFNELQQLENMHRELCEMIKGGKAISGPNRHSLINNRAGGIPPMRGSRKPSTMRVDAILTTQRQNQSYGTGAGGPYDLRGNEKGAMNQTQRAFQIKRESEIFYRPLMELVKPQTALVEIDLARMTQNTWHKNNANLNSAATPKSSNEPTTTTVKGILSQAPPTPRKPLKMNITERIWTRSKPRSVTQARGSTIQNKYTDLFNVFQDQLLPQSNTTPQTRQSKTPRTPLQQFPSRQRDLLKFNNIDQTLGNLPTATFHYEAYKNKRSLFSRPEKLVKNEEYLKGIKLPQMEQILMQEAAKDDQGRNFKQFKTKINKELESGNISPTKQLKAFHKNADQQQIQDKFDSFSQSKVSKSLRKNFPKNYESSQLSQKQEESNQYIQCLQTHLPQMLCDGFADEEHNQQRIEQNLKSEAEIQLNEKDSPLYTKKLSESKNLEPQQVFDELQMTQITSNVKSGDQLIQKGTQKLSIEPISSSIKPTQITQNDLQSESINNFYSTSLVPKSFQSSDADTAAFNCLSSGERQIESNLIVEGRFQQRNQLQTFAYQQNQQQEEDNDDQNSLYSVIDHQTSKKVRLYAQQQFGQSLALQTNSREQSVEVSNQQRVPISVNFQGPKFGNSFNLLSLTKQQLQGRKEDKLREIRDRLRDPLATNSQAAEWANLSINQLQKFKNSCETKKSWKNQEEQEKSRGMYTNTNQKTEDSLLMQSSIVYASHV